MNKLVLKNKIEKKMGRWLEGCEEGGREGESGKEKERKKRERER